MSLFQKYQLTKLTFTDRSFGRAARDFVAERVRFEVHSAFPRILCVRLVEGCNLRCVMCGQWRRNAVSGRRYRGEFLPLEKVKDLVAEAAVHDPEIFIWGGEPTLHPEFGKVLSCIKRKGLVCTVSTNGVLLQRLAKAILESRVDSLSVSLDGLTEVHDGIRGRKGTYAKVIKGLAELHKNGAGKRPLIRVVITLSNANLSHIEQLLCELENNDAVDISIINLGWFVTTEAGKAHEDRVARDFGLQSSSWTGFLDDKAGERAREIRGLVERIRRGEFRKPIVFFPSLRTRMVERYYANHSDHLGRIRCRTVYRQLNIMPNGNAVVCCDFPDIAVGNVYKQTVTEIWRGNRLREFRKNLKDKGLFTICNRCCGLFK